MMVLIPEDVDFLDEEEEEEDENLKMKKKKNILVKIYLKKNHLEN